MSEFVYPLDGQQDYTAEQAGAWMGTRGNGVWAGDDNLRVTVTGARQLTLSPGLAWFTTDDFWGKVYCNTDAINFALPVADAALDFICRIVIRWDKTANKGYANMLVGAMSSAETGVIPPARITTEEMYDLVIADYYVAAGETEASAGQLTDQRLNEDLCGLMRDGVERIPTKALQEQAEGIIEQTQTQAEETIAQIKEALSQVLDGQIADGAVSNLYTATLSSSGWTQADDYATQTLTIAGLKPAYKLIVDVDMTDKTASTAWSEVNDAWAELQKVTCDTENKITFYFGSAPTVDIPVKVVAIKK